jgi:hypothetical protein
MQRKIDVFLLVLLGGFGTKLPEASVAKRKAADLTI